MIEDDAGHKLARERRLVRKWQKERCEKSLAELLESHKAQLRSMALRRARDGTQADDLVSEGTIALVRALDRYEPIAGIPLMAYASPSIRAAMTEEANRSSHPVDIPRDVLRAAKNGVLPEDEGGLVKAAVYSGDIDDLNPALMGVDQGSGEAIMIERERRRLYETLIDLAMKDLAPEERALLQRKVERPETGIGGVAKMLGMSEYKARKMEARAMARMKGFFMQRGLTLSRLELVR